MPTPRKVVRTTWEELAKGVPVQTGIRYTFVVYRHYTDVFELEDAHFHLESPILLPVPDRVPDDPEQPYITALGVIAQALKFAADNPNRKLLVAAHVEPANQPGSSGRALALTKLRASNVLALLNGDGKKWAESCSEKHRVEDVQSLLRFADRRHGLGCDPGAINNQDSPAFRQALDAFRAGFKREHDNEAAKNLPDTGPVDTADFEAFFELTELCLADKLDTHGAGEKDPEKARAKLAFAPPESLSCGAQWPSAWSDRPFRRSRSNRKVELLFIPDDERPIPDLEKPQPPGAWLYGDQKRFMFNYYPVDPDPRITCVRLVGTFFDTNKCFLLPSAMKGIRKLVDVYARHPKGELLIVGHTDTSGEPEYNDPLSLERAEAVKAFLTDDVDAWLEWYEKSVPKRKRWGSKEDMATLEALPDGKTHTSAPDPIKSYQQSRGLDDDGIAGPNTRRQLIADYMALDGTSLPDQIRPVAHGCGENFPTNPKDVEQDKEDKEANRRVEIFLFEGKIAPPPPGEISKPGSKEYPIWRSRVIDEHDLRTERGPVLRLDLGAGQGVDFDGWFHLWTRTDTPENAPFSRRVKARDSMFDRGGRQVVEIDDVPEDALIHLRLEDDSGHVRRILFKGYLKKRIPVELAKRNDPPPAYQVG